MSRDSLQDFFRVCQLSADSGLQVAMANFDGINFGYWHIELRRKGKAARKLIWEARDSWFLIQSQKPDGSWADDEVIRDLQAAALDDLIKRLGE